MCCILRDRKEQYKTVAKGATLMSFQRLSIISQYPPVDTIQVIALKWVIVIYGILLVKTFLKMASFLFCFLVFSMVFLCILPLKKVPMSDYFFKASTLM